MRDLAPSSRNLLVLDLDETLIHAASEALGRPADHRVGAYHVYRRPHLTQFLDFCFGWYAVGVWSSASDAYVSDVVRSIFPEPDRLVFVWGASRVVRRSSFPTDYARYGMGLGEYHTRKPLKKLKQFGWPLDRILIVDDSPEKCAVNYGNAIYPAPYTGQPEDDELLYLASYLETLKERRTYRRLEKRGWKESVAPYAPAAC